MTKEVRAQGAQAKELGLSEYDNPYGPGENHDAWRGGFGLDKDTVEQVDTDGDKTTVRKGAASKKGKKDDDQPDPSKVVTRPTGTGETSLTTVIETAEPRAGEGAGAEVTIGDPSASTTAAENDGEGIVLETEEQK